MRTNTPDSVDSSTSSLPQLRKLGVLGIGEGRSILHASDRSQMWETSWICDLDAHLCEQRMREHRVGRSTQVYSEMLADPHLEVVAIYTPDPFHADHCMQALRAGKHVICTKPLVDDLARGRELLDAVQRSGKQLMVGMSCRFYDTFMEQKRRFDAGQVGTLLSVESHYHGDKRRGTSGRWGKEKANNWIYTGLVHPVDLVYAFAGLPEEVFGYGQVSPFMRQRGFAIADNFHFVLKGRDGLPLTVSGLYGSPANHREAEGMIGCVLRGTNGCLDARYPNFELFSTADDADAQRINRYSEHPYYFPWGGSSHHAGEFQNYLEHFAGCLDVGQPVVPDVGDGLRVIAILRAMEISLQRGRPVNVPELLREYGLEDLIA